MDHNPVIITHTPGARRSVDLIREDHQEMSMSDALSTTRTRNATTPQSEQDDPRQVQNSAGGFSFEVTPLARLRRFLVLGTDGGTYYIGERELTRQNAAVVFEMARTDHRALINEILDVSLHGRAPKQNPTIFALAAAVSPEFVASAVDRNYALTEVVPQVLRTGTHWLTFARYVEFFRGWGRALRGAVAHHYTDTPLDRLAYDMVKYRQRDGWSQRDLLRLSHPKTDQDSRRALFDWATSGATDLTSLPDVVRAFRAVQALEPGSVSEVVRWVESSDLSWEALPDWALNEAKVWEALLANGAVPLNALRRQLPRLTRLGVIKPLSDRTTSIALRLMDAAELRRARVHPLQMLVAARTYGSGVTQSTSFTPVPEITHALERGFYSAFGAIEPSNKRTMLCLDVSSSMTWGRISGMPINPAEGSAAMALVTAATEPRHHIMGFSDELKPLNIHAGMTLDQVIATTNAMSFGRTDCSLPMIYAAAKGLEVDTFVVYTDNETWAGWTHPHEALRGYRQRSRIDARLVVVGMAANIFTIADPSDTGMLDVVGFDTATPNIISDFSAGRI
jgi:60 kDa SS-A/Ro ribonucleoprotein